MIFSKILYNNDKAAEAIFVGDTDNFEIELKAILESASKDKNLSPILYKVICDIANELEEELKNE